MEEKFLWNHTLQITLNTQFMEDSTIAELVKKILGPWCVECKIIKLNEEK